MNLNYGKEMLFRLLLYGTLIIIAFIYSFPFLWMVSGSLKTLPEVFRIPLKLLPTTPQWINYMYAWRMAPFARFFFNSFFVSSMIVVVQFATTCLACYALSVLKVPGRNLIFIIILAMMMIPAQAIFVPRYIIIARFGWMDNYLALIAPYFASPFGIFIVRQGFLKVPQDLIDAAKIDGAGHLRILGGVMIPLSKPVLMTFMLFNFIWHYNEFFWPLLVTNTNRVRTVPIGLSMFRSAAMDSTSAFMWNHLMAACTFTILPILVLFIFTQKFIVKGLMTTGMKG